MFANNPWRDLEFFGGTGSAETRGSWRASGALRRLQNRNAAGGV